MKAFLKQMGQHATIQLLSRILGVKFTPCFLTLHVSEVTESWTVSLLGIIPSFLARAPCPYGRSDSPAPHLPLQSLSPLQPEGAF